MFELRAKIDTRPGGTFAFVPFLFFWMSASGAWSSWWAIGALAEADIDCIGGTWVVQAGACVYPESNHSVQDCVLGAALVQAEEISIMYHGQRTAKSTSWMPFNAWSKLATLDRTTPIVHPHSVLCLCT